MLLTNAMKNMASVSVLRALAVVLIAFPVGGCYSLTELRVSQQIGSGEQQVTVGLWVRAPGMGGDVPVGNALTAVVFYPLDVFMSSVVAVGAICDPEVDISWGPVGAVAGIALPWVTLIPHVCLPGFMMQPSPDAHLDPQEFATLVSRIRTGDGLAAYLEIVDPAVRVCSGEIVLSVVLLGPVEPTAQRAQSSSRRHLAPRLSGRDLGQASRLPP